MAGLQALEQDLLLEVDELRAQVEQLSKQREHLAMRHSVLGGFIEARDLDILQVAGLVGLMR